MTLHALWKCAAVGLLAALLPLGTLRAQSAAPEVAPIFRQYYNARQGIRVLGNPIGRFETASAHYAQYFEKGLLEDHRGETADPDWQFMYARLAADLLAVSSLRPIGGDTSDVNYVTLRERAGALQPPPREGVDGIVVTERGVFVPYNAELKAGPGHYVADRFWAYINRADLFPGGWLHDIGLPMTEVLDAGVTKGGARRAIQVQAFERAVLTYDAQNPADWQVERDNIGVAHRAVFPPGWADGSILRAINGAETTAPAFSAQIQRVEGAFVRALLFPNDPNATDPAWVWLRQDVDRWTVFGGPGTEFDETFYQQNGVPQLIRLDNPLETALYDTLNAWVPANSAIGEFSVPNLRIEAGVARLTLVPSAGQTDPATAYARLIDINSWQVLGLGTSFEPEWYEQNDIPEVLR